MTLRDMMGHDASLVFTSTSDFGEAITYKPFVFSGQVSRSNRTINAVVQRETRESMTQDGVHAIDVFEVHVTNSSSSGISSEEIDLGRDRLNFAPRVGESAKDYVVYRIVDHDDAMLVLECR